MVAGGVLLQFAFLLVAVGGLWIGARVLVDATVRIARRFQVSDLVIGLTIVAMGTSTPEAVVTTDAALAGIGDIAVGNIVGSNIYNLAFILGTLAIIRHIPVERSLLRRDGTVLVLSTIGGFLALLDHQVTRAEGFLLAGLFLLYTLYVIHDERVADEGATAERIAPLPASVPERWTFPGQDGLLFLVGLAVVLATGHLMVTAATDLASAVGISDWVIGGTIVAAGTSTPEFAVSVVALRNGHAGVSIGNVVGSNIFNLLGILGVAAAVRPLTVAGSSTQSLLWLAAITLVVAAALWSGGQLSRLEGGLLAVSELVRWLLGLFRIFG